MKKLFYLFLFMLAGCCAWAQESGSGDGGETTTPTGYTVSGSIARATDAQSYDQIAGTIYLKVGTEVKYTQTFDTESGSKKNYTIANVAPGTYTMEVIAQLGGDSYSAYLEYTKAEVKVETADITENIDLIHDKTKAWLAVYTRDDAGGLNGVSVTVGSETKTSASYYARFICTAGQKYTITCSKEGYKDLTLENQAVNAPGEDSMVRGKEIEARLAYDYDEITLKGSVTNAPKEGLTVALLWNDKDIEADAPIEDGAYTIDVAPNKGNIGIVVSEANYSYVDDPSKNWAIVGAEDDPDGILFFDMPADVTTEYTKDLTLKRIGVRVKAVIKDKVTGGAVSGYGTMLIGGKTPNSSNKSVDGMQAGEHVVSAKGYGGYEDYEGKLTIAALNTLSNDTVITCLFEMTPKLMTHKFYGKVRLNPYTTPEPIEGAKVVMYKNGDSVDMKTTDAEGYYEFPVQGYVTDKYTFKFSHTSIDAAEIKDVTIQASSESSDLSYYVTFKRRMPGIENLQAEQITIAGKQGVKLSWAWPSELTEDYGEGKKYEISMVNINRMISGDYYSSVGLSLRPGEDGALPLPEYIDTASNPALQMGKAYAYSVSIQYVAPESILKSVGTLTITLLSSEAVTLKGNVSISGQENATLNGGLWLAIESGDELALAEIKEGKYEFKDVKLNGILHYNLLSKAETETANLEQNRSKNWKFGNQETLEYTLSGADENGVFTNDISIKRVAATVRGTIKDQRTNQYMEAYACIGTDTVRTNSNGLFAIEGMAEGEHTVWMWAKGYEGPISKTITVPDLLTILPNDFNEYVDTVLVPKNEARVFFGELSYMNSANEAVKIAGAKVEMYEVTIDTNNNEVETKLEEVTTGADGKFEFSKTCRTNTTYKFKASHERMENAVSNLVYANDTRVEVRIHCTMKKVELLGMENPKATQKENEMSVDLSWSWPAALVSNYKTTYLIRNIVVKRICGTDTTEVGSVTPDSTELPATKFTDSKDLKQDETYTYFFVMNYVKPVDAALVVANPALTVKMVVKTDTTANEEFELSAWKAYANNGTLTLVSSTPCQYGVYTSTGALVEQGRMSEGEHRVSVKQTGVYVVRRISQTGISVRKVFVK